ncbi:MAG: hypothetical protein ABIQ39_03515, partial [Ilumatobacteraceae bacterium]
ATAAEEHRLLGAVLEALLTVSELDVPGDNGGVATRVHVATSSVAGGIAEHQVWESLGVALRPSLALVVEFAMRPQAETDIATAAEKITIGMQHVDVPAAAAGAAAATGAAAAGAAAGSADSATRTWTAFRIRESH